jgi:uncharacterized protein GlcG (DUF336 family)
MTGIALNDAARLCELAFEKGRELGLAPLTVAVLDAGGVVVCLMRQDGSSLMRPDIAIGKAWGTLGFGFGGREIERRAKAMPGFFSVLSDMSGGRMVPVPGGVIIRDQAGAILGAVGVTGDTSLNDEACAVHAIAAIGLVADNGDK